MFIKVIIVVMGIFFMGYVVIWEGEEDFFSYGIFIVVVIVVLSYFFSIKIDKGEVEK